jgi:hypothetical protein
MFWAPWGIGGDDAGAQSTSGASLGPGGRKSVQPLAVGVVPGDGEQLHHFACTSGRDVGPVGPGSRK